jgi:hypothetical protein
MKTRRRCALFTLAVCMLGAAVLASAAQADFGFEGNGKWEAGTCKGTKVQVKNCEYVSPPSSFYTQAAGHPPWGLTGFELNHSGSGTSRVPEGSPLKRIRVDVPPGLAADPQTLLSCERSTFENNPKLCPVGSEAGFVELEAVVKQLGLNVLAPAMEGTVYNLDQEPGLPLLFGIAVEPASPIISSVKLLLEGHVSYAREPNLEAHDVPSGDFHEYFEINNIPSEVELVGLVKSPLQTLKSKLFFNGQAGNGNFLTLPSVCGGPQNSISYLEVESQSGEVKGPFGTEPPVGVDGCKTVPFKPTTLVSPGAPGYDQPDGAITEVLVPQNEAAGEENTADISEAHVMYPEGLTLNPSAAHGLEACTPEKMHFETKLKAECPAGSRLGSAVIETDLPAGSLAGSVYLAAVEGVPITNPPFHIYLVAESAYDVKVKLEGTVTPNPATGRLKVDFSNMVGSRLNLPQLPFSKAKITLNPGSRAPLANPVSCAKAATESDFLAYSGENVFKQALPSTPFAATGCPGTIPFAVSQGTSETNKQGGAFTSFTFSLGRNDGNQNLGKVQTVLPAGLVGLIPSVPRCAEPQAAAGNCPKTSEIGKASALAGVGSEPYAFSGPVYLTGPTGGQPFGLSIPIEAAAGPFDLGRITTVATIGVDQHTGRVIATATLPSIWKGVPLHLRGITVEVTKPNFMFNPTNCGPLSTNSLLSSLQGGTTGAATPFAVSGCSSLAFKPVFAARSPSQPSRAKGASLIVSYTQPQHQANIKSVMATLPKQLPSRLTTLHNACTEQVFAGGNNYKSCPSGSKVGSATVKTPVLPEPLKGPAYLVSHGGAAFPDLDLILEGDHGVKVILEGNTNIKNGITTSTFASVPDVPVSSFELNLPTGPNSALGSYESLCAKPLYMPTLITAQSGKVLKQNVRLSIGSCKIKLLSHRVKGHKLILRVKVFTAGRLSVKSPGLHTTFKKVKGPGVITLKVALSNKGRRTLAAGRSLKTKFRVGFNPRHKDEYHSAAFAKATFKH